MNILLVSPAILIILVSILPSRSISLSILVAIVIGSLIYALRGQNIKQMIRLYPEEKNQPLPSRIFLRAYRIFMLIVIPGLPIYFITLKLVGVINWAWWWVVAPLWVPLTIFIVMWIALNLFGLKKQSLN